MVLKAGSTVLVPRSEEQDKDIAQEVAETATLAMEPDLPPTRRISVKVGRRDTLASIAARHGVSVAQVKAWNSLSHDAVTRGQTLALHVPNQLRVMRTSAGTPRIQRQAPRVISARATGHQTPKTLLAGGPRNLH